MGNGRDISKELGRSLLGDGVDDGLRGTHLNVLPCRESMSELCSSGWISSRLCGRSAAPGSSTRRALFDGLEGRAGRRLGGVSLGTQLYWRTR